MTVREIWNNGIQFLPLCVVYYAIQLIRCTLFSFVVSAVVFTLRKRVLKDRVFLRCAVWSLFLPVLFIGRLRFFYESKAGIKLFSWLTEICMNYRWLCVLYFCGAALYAVRLFRRRRKAAKMVKDMEKRKVEGTSVYVTKLPVTPSAVGAFRPRIVIPEVILKEYDQKEIRTILFHEKVHIRLGHLLLYLFWDILRALLWLNPLLAVGARYLREDMEELCDCVTISRSEGNAYGYGQLLLKSMRLLQAEREDFNMYVTFAGNQEYHSIRQRVARIAGYKPYKRSAAAGMAAVAALCVIAAAGWIQECSYGRYNPIDSITVYDMGAGTELVSDSEALRKVVCYDETCIYIKEEGFRKLLRNSSTADCDICIYIGGYYKLPGIGGGGNFGYLDEAVLEDNILKIEYKRQRDVFERILKWI